MQWVKTKVSKSEASYNTYEDKQPEKKQANNHNKGLQSIILVNSLLPEVVNGVKSHL